jgi:hypothetical protein
MKKENEKQEEMKYPEGEERLILGGKRDEFTDFELRLKVDNITRQLRYALEEAISLQNMIYWQTREDK